MQLLTLDYRLFYGRPDALSVGEFDYAHPERYKEWPPAFQRVRAAEVELIGLTDDQEREVTELNTEFNNAIVNGRDRYATLVDVGTRMSKIIKRGVYV